MLHILWGILNIAVFIFFVIIFFRAIRLIREHFGLFAAIIFVLGLFAFMRSSEKDRTNEPGNNIPIRTFTFVSIDSVHIPLTNSIRVILEKTPISKYMLFIHYGIDRRTQITMPVHASSYATGITSGLDWRPVAVVVNRTSESGKFSYQVDGTLEWNLLNLTLYSQSKSYEGDVIVR